MVPLQMNPAGQIAQMRLDVAVGAVSSYHVCMHSKMAVHSRSDVVAFALDSHWFLAHTSDEAHVRSAVSVLATVSYSCSSQTVAVRQTVSA